MKTATFMAAAAALALLAFSASTVDAQSMDITSLIPLLQATGLTSFLTVANLVQLQQALETYNAITLLIPNEAAFAALGPELLQTLLQSYNADWLQSILLYHVIGQPLSSDALLGLIGQGAGIPTLLGPSLPISRSGLGILLGGANVVQPNLQFRNGNQLSTAHVINRVLVPPELTLPPTITQMVIDLNRQGQFTILYKALTEFKSGFFTDLLSQNTRRGYTVFAPTDAAFEALPAQFRTFPMNEETKRVLYKILVYHVVGRSARSDQLKNDSRLLTKLGKLIHVRFRRGVGVILNNQAKVVQADVRASNGIIHAIDKVLMP